MFSKQVLTIGLNGRGDVLTQALVDVQHVQVDASQLHHKRVTDGLTRPHIGLQDATELTHRLRVLQDVYVLTNDKDASKVLN